MWMWWVALLGTLVGLAMAWRSLRRAEAGLEGLRQLSDSMEPLTAQTATLEVTTRETARSRMLLHTRSSSIEP